MTEKEYSKKLSELIEKTEKLKAVDIKLLQTGRHFWKGETKIILGRNHEENLTLKKMAQKNLPVGEAGDILVEPNDIPGPTALIRGKENKAVLDYTKKLLLRYTKNAGEDLLLKITLG